MQNYTNSSKGCEGKFPKANRACNENTDLFWQDQEACPRSHLSKYTHTDIQRSFLSKKKECARQKEEFLSSL